MSKILLAGNDFRLLATRGAVLSKTHANVTCCNALETMQLLESETFDLVVLCHSLDVMQAAEITERVHQRLPKVKVLLVASEVESDLLSSSIPFDTISSPEPKDLIARTSELLKQALPNLRIERPAPTASRHPVAEWKLPANLTVSRAEDEV
ncbi:hypothetical protein P8936_06735 [Edaphobacter paludis]|uniref:Response regulatory domain-containing protein n=1 Tax=Edaphobacter paludis TaxID=3035702 RepID=A0AAU7DCJ0_9BACT